MIEIGGEEMKCRHCGAVIDDDSVFCSVCGSNQHGLPNEDVWRRYFKPDEGPGVRVVAPPQDAKNNWWAILCFLFPIVGLILYFVWKKDLPHRARSCGYGAAVGAFVWALAGICLFMFTLPTQ